MDEGEGEHGQGCPLGEHGQGSQQPVVTCVALWSQPLVTVRHRGPTPQVKLRLEEAREAREEQAREREQRRQVWAEEREGERERRGVKVAHSSARV